MRSDARARAAPIKFISDSEPLRVNLLQLLLQLLLLYLWRVLVSPRILKLLLLALRSVRASVCASVVLVAVLLLHAERDADFLAVVCAVVVTNLLNASIEQLTEQKLADG